MCVQSPGVCTGQTWLFWMKIKFSSSPWTSHGILSWRRFMLLQQEAMVIRSAVCRGSRCGSNPASGLLERVILYHKRGPWSQWQGPFESKCYVILWIHVILWIFIRFWNISQCLKTAEFTFLLDRRLRLQDILRCLREHGDCFLSYLWL